MSGEFANVKAGDYVAERGGWGGPRVYRVDRVTATQIITGENRWSKDRGRLVGSAPSSYNARYVRVASKEDFLAARINRVQNRISQIKITAANVGAAELLISATDAGKAQS